MDNQNDSAATPVATRMRRGSPNCVRLWSTRQTTTGHPSRAWPDTSSERSTNASASSASDVFRAVDILQARKSHSQPLSPEEAEALGVLYRRYAIALLRVATHLTGSATDGQDVVHDVFVQLAYAIKRFRPGNLEAWLKRVTATTALMRLRTVRRHREDIPPTLDFVADDVASHDLEALEDIEGVRNAVEGLPEALRRVVVLKGFLGYTHSEIAALLNITPNACEVRYCRAVTMLRSLLRHKTR